MLGGMFAGHDESGTGEIIERNGRKYKLFYGMSSKTAMDKHVRIIFLMFFFLYFLDYSRVVWRNIEHRKVKLLRSHIEEVF
jgi:hypothetical protein